MCEGVIYFSFVCAGSGAAPASLCWKLAPVALLLLSLRQALFLHKINLNKFMARLSVGCQHLAFHYFPDKEPHLKLLLLTSFLSFCLSILSSSVYPSVCPKGTSTALYSG